ncbi:VOC family protein [Bremerella alba]|uniref:VOC domain-containing protein n=1 Tax=Bremerella alba TaxID=980252 RepID=A0A7V8V643_9BACT|nr:VOC family protein [Bremerella alba]MBA2115653.1 hypothetical protein [Bremerella alba]
MREITPNELWIANALQVRDIRATLLAGATAIVDLAMEERPIAFPRDILYCRFPLLDGTGNPQYLLQTCIETVAKLVEAKRPTIIACSAGMSRSPVVAAAAIAQVKDMTLEASLLKLTEKGPHDVSPALLYDVLQAMPRLNSCQTRVNLIALRSRDPEVTVRFYQSLGLILIEEQHDQGPIHWASDTNDFVLEIYPAKSAEPIDSSTSIGLEVSEIGTLVQQLRHSGTTIVREPKAFAWGVQAIVQDPDGRSVILVDR